MNMKQVVGSVGAEGIIVYWVEWQDMPGVPVAIAWLRIRPISDDEQVVWNNVRLKTH